MTFFKEQPFNIVVTISGKGKRFADAGFRIPKPLIEVLGKPMVSWGIASCDFLSELKMPRLIFTVRNDHKRDFKIDERLREIFGGSIVVIGIDTETWPNGQAAHAFAAKDYINNDERLLILSCDTYSISPLAKMIEEENPDGILPCFNATEERFSYAKIDSDGYVSETAEKRRISSFATNGHYYFRRGSDFIHAVDEMIAKGDALNGEYYAAPTYNYLIKNGRKVKISHVTKNWVMGTPEELEQFLANYKP